LTFPLDHPQSFVPAVVLDSCCRDVGPPVDCYCYYWNWKMYVRMRYSVIYALRIL